MPEKIIVAGSRTFTDQNFINKFLDEIYNKEPFELVCGMAPGVDFLAYQWAQKKGVQIHEFPANWRKHGNSAGAIRNNAMAEFADSAILFWDGKSRGTRIMLDMMKRYKKPVQVHQI